MKSVKIKGGAKHPIILACLIEYLSIQLSNSIFTFVMFYFMFCLTEITQPVPLL